MENTATLEEKNIHFIFEASLILKAIFASFEIIAGILVYFISPVTISRLIMSLADNEIIENPSDLFISTLSHAAESFSVGSQHFASFYLLSHGIVKLCLIIGLLRRKISFYPASMFVFGLFILYQLYRYTFTQSPWLLVLTVLDVFIIWLTLHEYKYLKRMRMWR